MRKKKTELTKPTVSRPITTVSAAAPATVIPPTTVIPPVAIIQPATVSKETSAQELAADNWPALWQRLPLAGVIRNTAAHCCLERVDGNNYYFTLDREQAGLFDESHTARLAETLGNFLNKTCAVFITPGTPSSITPHQAQQQKRAQQQQEAEESFRNDANVIALLQQFDGEIIADSIVPFQKSLH